MKLYTEEQVRQSFRNGFIYANLNEINENQTIDSLTPIELPSDEEIDTASLMISKDRKEFLMGAKYVINKIQGGNK